MNLEDISSKIYEMKHEYADYTDMDYDTLDQVLPITVELEGNKYLVCTVYLIEDDWDYHLHRVMMNIFDVVLIDYKINYSAADYDIENNVYRYIYATEGYAEPLDFFKRYVDFRLLYAGDYYGSADVRTLTHKILKDLRELDNIGVEYNGIFDDRDLRRFLGQTEYYLKHFKGKMVGY